MTNPWISTSSEGPSATSNPPWQAEKLQEEGVRALEGFRHQIRGGDADHGRRALVQRISLRPHLERGQRPVAKSSTHGRHVQILPTLVVDGKRQVKHAHNPTELIGAHRHLVALSTELIEILEAPCR